MPRDGLGNYTLPAPDIANGQTSDANDFNLKVNDIASALGGSLAADGQKASTGNQNMGNFRHIAVADSQQRNEYATAGQVQDGKLTWLTGLAGANTITANAPVAMSTYVAGQSFRGVILNTNTGPVDISINGLANKSVTKNGNVALVAGDLPAGSIADFDYDGTSFQVTVVTDRMPISGGTFTGAINEKRASVIPSAASINLTSATGNQIDVTGTTNISSITLQDGAERVVVFGNVLTLIAGPNLVLPANGANITTATGDVAVFRGFTPPEVRCVSYTRSSGLPIVNPPSPSTPYSIANGGTGATTAADARTNLGLDSFTIKCSIAFACPGGVLTTLDSSLCSVSRTGVGRYRITFTNAMPTVYYKMFQTADSAGGSPWIVGFDVGGSRTQNICDIITQTGPGVLGDVNYCTIGFFV